MPSVCKKDILLFNLNCLCFRVVGTTRGLVHARQMSPAQPVPQLQAKTFKFPWVILLRAKIRDRKPDVGAHACNPSIQRLSPESLKSKAHVSYIVTPVSKEDGGRAGEGRVEEDREGGKRRERGSSSN